MFAGLLLSKKSKIDPLPATRSEPRNMNIMDYLPLPNVLLGNGLIAGVMV